jgi:putative NADH-flavin reductase
MRIKVLGGTGYAGSHVVREAVARGHAVTSYSRNAPTHPVEGATYRAGSAFDDAFLRESVSDTDVVFVALSPRGELQGRLEGVVDRLIELATEARVRLGLLGGASSLLVAPGGPRLIDVSPPPPEVLPEVNTGIALLDTLENRSPEDLDWFYVSPAASFGAWVPGEATGTYRVGGDVLLVDEDGQSNISGADLAAAVLDELETPEHRRRRFHVAY